MDILIFSDSHGNADALQRALAAQPHRPHAICFLGDGLRDLDTLQTNGIPMYAVKGNCDWGSPLDRDLPTERILWEEGHTILMVHGHTYNVKSGVGALIARAAVAGADVVLFGHTHSPCEHVIRVGERIGDTVLTRPMYLFNPGSIGYGGYGGGCSFGTLHLRADTVLFSHGSV